MSKASVFIVSTPTNKSTKRPINELQNKTVAQLIQDFQKLYIFVGDGASDLLFVDQNVAIHLSPELCPSIVFPQLSYALVDTIDLSMEKMTRLGGITTSSKMINCFEISFRHVNGFYKPVTVRFPLTPGYSNLGVYVKNVIGNQLWGAHIANIAHSLSIAEEQLILMMKSPNRDLVLLPFMSVADTIGELFDVETGVYSGNYQFLYDIARGKSESDRRSKYLKKLSEVDGKRLAHFEENFLSRIKSDEIYEFVYILMDFLVREFSTGFTDDLVSVMKSLLSESFVDIMRPTICSVKPFDSDMKRWKELVKWFKASVQLDQLPIDFTKKPKGSLSVVAAVAIAKQEDIIERAVDITAKYVNFFKSSRSTSQWASLLGPIIFITRVIIGDDQDMTLVLTRGFIYVINVKMAGDAKYEILPDTFEGEKGSIVFTIPLSQWEFVPFPDEAGRSIGILSSDKTLFVMRFQDETGSSKSAFWLCYAICKNEIHNNSLSVDVGTAKSVIQLTYPTTVNDFNMYASVSILGQKWEAVVPQSELVKAVLTLEQYRGVEIMANERKQIVPSRYISYANVVFRKYNIDSSIVASAIEENKLYRVSAANTNQQHLVHCTFVDMIYSFNPHATFAALYLIKLADVEFAMKIKCTELLERQLEAFHDNLSELSINSIPLLHHACLTTDSSGLIHMLGQRCQSTKDGRSPIFYAIDNNNLLIMQALVDMNIDINCCGNDKISPLIYCLQKHNYSIAEYLLKNGAFVNRMNMNSHPCYNSALFYAISRRDYDMVKLLVPYCSNEINNPSIDGSFVTHICIKENFTEVLELFYNIPQFDPNMCSDTYPHPLIYLVEKEKKPKMEDLNHLLRIPTIDVNATNPDGNTLLIIAMKNIWTDIVLRLCSDERCDVDICDNQGRTPAYLAVHQNNPLILNALVKAGVIVSMPNLDGMTPLYHAVEMDSLELVKILLDAGVIPDEWYTNGKLPVHIARRDDIKEILISHNANPDSPIFDN